MNPKEICVNTRNWVDSVQDRGYCGCDIVPPDSISHGICLIGMPTNTKQIYLTTEESPVISDFYLNICLFADAFRPRLTADRGESVEINQGQ